MMNPVLAPGNLVVSCQAQPGNPLADPAAMALMARAAAAGGAGGIRANGPRDIVAIRSVTDLPIIGIHKRGDPAGVFITPTLDDAAAIVRAGADLVAVDGTRRPRPDSRTLAEQIRGIHEELGVGVIADVDDLRAGLAAREAGADLVATTLSGYTGGEVPGGPDLDLVRLLAGKVDCPVIAEGRIRTPDHVRAACEAGAYAVVVGYAITNPMDITARMVQAIPDREVV
ncbi:N-acetylmannosamine-6-phosphate 2-epimerase [Kribbella deserti]|uniref:N-acylglucosamine-6-phosphate 2-epimerase n=1 Tax=Kribbella deserti TaxID=1926257 RepID=A0ABV6QQT1_9ACTN